MIGRRARRYDIIGAVAAVAIAGLAVFVGGGRGILAVEALAGLIPVPSAVWRCSMALELPVGVDPEYRRQYYAFPSA